jgi:hypothetical protein
MSDRRKRLQESRSAERRQEIVQSHFTGGGANFGEYVSPGEFRAMIRTIGRI